MSDAALGTRAASPVADESSLTKTVAIALSIAFLALFFLAPLLVVVAEASSKGLTGYISAILEPDARAAIGLTLLVAAVVVPLNAAFGLAAAWCISKFQ